MPQRDDRRSLRKVHAWHAHSAWPPPPPPPPVAAAAEAPPAPPIPPPPPPLPLLAASGPRKAVTLVGLLPRAVPERLLRRTGALTAAGAGAASVAPLTPPLPVPPLPPGSACADAPLHPRRCPSSPARDSSPGRRPDGRSCLLPLAPCPPTPLSLALDCASISLCLITSSIDGAGGRSRTPSFPSTLPFSLLLRPLSLVSLSHSPNLSTTPGM